VIDRLAGGVDRALAECGIADHEVVEVPGAFEIPFAARTLAASGRVDAIVAVGAVIRGETTHYDLVSEECARGLQDVQISTGVPIGFGVLATENLEQALARSEGADGHNVGADAAQVAVEMAILARDWR
jgi:6,7-dimethyl-8-ribityllumazine synthase